MTASTRSSLKTRFESGDVPEGADFADLIDSSVNLLDTANQSLSGPLTAPSAAISTVTGTNLSYTNATLTSANITFAAVSNLQVTSFGVDAPFASVYVSGPVTATVSATVSSVAVPGNWEICSINKFSVSANKVIYTAPVTARFHMHCAGVASTSAAETLSIYFNLGGNDILKGHPILDFQGGIKTQFNVQTVQIIKPNDELYLRAAHTNAEAWNYVSHRFSLVITEV